MVRSLLVLILTGCIIDKFAYEDALAALSDDDGDGVPPAGGDCDDDDATRYPGATETWYDGIDQDCAGDDDNDADGDGDPDAAHGGADCDDEDPTVAGISIEGWSDLGIDNDCDGDLSEAVLYPLSDSLASIEGPSASAALGERLMVTPEGWISEEPWLLASASQGDGLRGAAYGWSASDLLDAPTVDSAALARIGALEGDVLGYGLGWSGDEAIPQTWVSAEGRDDGAGEIYGWLGDAILGDAEPTWTITGTDAQTYAGYQLTEGYDHDADGVADLAVSVPLDSEVAAYAGKVCLFTDTTSLPETTSLDDADVTLTTSIAGGLLKAWTGGDLDGDGRDDLVAYVTSETDVVAGGSYIITDALGAGSYDVAEVFALKVFGTANYMADIDLDGQPELIATTADLYRYELPEDDVYLNAEAHADASAVFTNDVEVNWLWRGEADGFGTATRLVVGSPMVEDGNYRGRVFLLPLRWDGDVLMDDQELRLDGEQAGDAAGTDVVLLPDLNGDGARELAVGAPGADGAGAGAGRVYIAAGPR